MSDSNYILAYTGESKLQFYRGHNLYLGVANLTDMLEHADTMTLDDAEAAWNCMNVKDDWQIWSVRPGVVLDQQSTRHIVLAKVRAKRRELEEIMSQLPKDDA